MRERCRSGFLSYWPKCLPFYTFFVCLFWEGLSDDLLSHENFPWLENFPFNSLPSKTIVTKQTSKLKKYISKTPYLPLRPTSQTLFKAVHKEMREWGRRRAHKRWPHTYKHPDRWSVFSGKTSRCYEM